MTLPNALIAADAPKRPYPESVERIRSQGRDMFGHGRYTTPTSSDRKAPKSSQSFIRAMSERPNPHAWNSVWATAL
jgi:hypothetical protein